MPSSSVPLFEVVVEQSIGTVYDGPGNRTHVHAALSLIADHETTSTTTAKGAPRIPVLASGLRTYKFPDSDGERIEVTFGKDEKTESEAETM